MARNFIFIVLYFLLSKSVSAQSMGYLLIAHCTLNIISDYYSKRNLLHIMTSFYIGIMIITFSNINFITKVVTYGITPDMMYSYIDTNYLDEAMLLWCVGNAAIFMGYEIFIKNSLPSIRVDMTNKKYLKNMYLIIIVMLIMRYTGHAINLRFLGGGAETALALVGAIGILFFARIAAKENDRTYMRYAIVLFVAETLMALVSSFLREDLVVPIIMLYAGYLMGKGHIKHLLNYRIIPAIVVVVLFSQFFQNLGGNRAHFIDAISFSNNATSNYLSDQEDPNKRGGAFERVSSVAQLTNIVRLTRENGFYNGRASEPLLLALIPRAIWPDKPIVQLGAWFALEIGAAKKGDNGAINNSINMTILGQLYLDFNWIGVLLGGVLFGGLVALFWNSAGFNDSPYNLTGTLWGGYLMLYSLSGVGADLQIVISLFSTYFVFYIIKRIITLNENNSNRAVVAG